MSIGNLKDYGNKGNNFPFQKKVLDGLQCNCDELKDIKSISQFFNLESANFSDPSMGGLVTQFNNFYITKPTWYFISQNTFYDPTTNEFVSIITYSKP